MRARRAMLYMPGDDSIKIHKSTTLGVDAICMDMEDGVASNHKNEARWTIVEALHNLDFGSSERLVRINPVGSGLEMDDLQVVLPARPDGIVVPKVQHGEQIRQVSQIISQFERENGWPEGSILIIAVVESARAIVNLHSIAGADPRLAALIFGAEDLAENLGAIRTTEGWEVFYARSSVVTYAIAFNLQAIDMVYTHLKDLDGLRLESLQGAQMGFTGKQIIHPDQVEPVQAAYTPSQEAIAHALRLVEAFNAHQQAGQGAFVIDGRMVDAPVVKSAQGVLARARAAGIL